MLFLVNIFYSVAGRVDCDITCYSNKISIVNKYPLDGRLCQNSACKLSLLQRDSSFGRK